MDCVHVATKHPLRSRLFWLGVVQFGIGGAELVTHSGLLSAKGTAVVTLVGGLLVLGLRLVSNQPVSFTKDAVSVKAPDPEYQGV